MAAMVGTTLVNDASAAAEAAGIAHRSSVIGSRRPSTTSERSLDDGGGTTFGRSDVMRADLRLAAAVSRKGRIGNIVVLEIAKESAASAVYKEYTRAELLDRVTRIIARHASTQRRHRGRAADGSAAAPAPTHSGVSYRDLHTIDPAMDTSSNPALLVRRGCIVVSMPPLHALITADHVLLFPEPGADGDLQPLLEHLHSYGAAPPAPAAPATADATPAAGRSVFAATPGGGAPVTVVVSPSPGVGDDTRQRDFLEPDVPTMTAGHQQGSFEYEALSVILTTAEATRDRELARLADECAKVTNSRKAGEAQVERLQHAEDSTRDFVSSLEATIKAVEELCNTQEDVDSLVLSLPPARGAQPPVPKQAQRPPLSAQDERAEEEEEGLEYKRAMEVIRFEELFEWFLAESENALSDARLLISRLGGERNRITLVLASNRNTLLKINITIQIITAMFGGCSMVSGFFGMNLDNGICGPDGCQSTEGMVDHGHAAFVKVSTITCGISLAFGLLILILVRELTH